MVCALLGWQTPEGTGSWSSRFTAPGTPGGMQAAPAQAPASRCRDTQRGRPQSSFAE